MTGDESNDTVYTDLGTLHDTTYYTLRTGTATTEDPSDTNLWDSCISTGIPPGDCTHSISIPPIQSQYTPILSAGIHRPFPDCADVQPRAPTSLIHLHTRPCNHRCVIRTQRHRRKHQPHTVEPPRIQHRPQEPPQEVVRSDTPGNDKRLDIPAGLEREADARGEMLEANAEDGAGEEETFGVHHAGVLCHLALDVRGDAGEGEGHLAGVGERELEGPAVFIFGFVELVQAPFGDWVGWKCAGMGEGVVAEVFAVSGVFCCGEEGRGQDVAATFVETIADGDVDAVGDYGVRCQSGGVQEHGMAARDEEVQEREVWIVRR
jgi:hypothetical protein